MNTFKRSWPYPEWFLAPIFEVALGFLCDVFLDIDGQWQGGTIRDMPRPQRWRGWLLLATQLFVVFLMCLVVILYWVSVAVTYVLAMWLLLRGVHALFCETATCPLRPYVP